mgnify:CR=1 FL=1
MSKHSSHMPEESQITFIEAFHDKMENNINE